jgi:hypothetical protein
VKTLRQIKEALEAPDQPRTYMTEYDLEVSRRMREIRHALALGLPIPKFPEPLPEPPQKQSRS